MKENVKMICPGCRIFMNFHAVKIDYTRSSDQTAEEHEGILEEFHSCPECGMTAERERSDAD